MKNQPSDDSRVEDKLPLVVILGPTAAGKTELAIHLADQFQGEIVSADSRLLYRGMDIGTAKPTLKQRKLVPHHLIDVADPDEVWSLTLFQRAAHEAINDILNRGRLPFLVGGTGQYVHAITEAWNIPEVKPNLPLRHILEGWAAEIGKQGLHSRLAVIDPVAASNIDYRNQRRTIRALEVIFISGRSFSEQRQRGNPPFRSIQIGLIIPRPELYERIDARVDSMLAAGFVSEVESLLTMGYSPDLPTFSAIGYQEIIDYLYGKTTLVEAVTLIRRRTRQLARRQANWFKEDDPDIYWFNNEHPSSEIAAFLFDKLDPD